MTTAIRDLCSGTNYSAGPPEGGMRRGRKSPCPVCGRRIGMRPGRAGRLYPHSVPAGQLVTPEPAGAPAGRYREGNGTR
jgi:hypothetical protein